MVDRVLYVGGCKVRSNSSIHVRLLDQFMAPLKIVRGDIYTCSVRPNISMYEHALLWGPPMTYALIWVGGSKGSACWWL